MTTSDLPVTTNDPPDNKIKIRNNEAIRFIEILIGFGFLSILIYACNVLTWDAINNPVTNSILIFSLGILVAGCALSSGCFIGFIFAIPKSITTSETTMIRTKIGYISNDNLVQISDWLTKIIVGVGLTKLTRIPGYIQAMGEYIGDSLGGKIWGQIAADSIVIYFAISGFLLSYLWTRLYFAKMLEDS